MYANKNGFIAVGGVISWGLLGDVARGLTCGALSGGKSREGLSSEDVVILTQSSFYMRAERCAKNLLPYSAGFWCLESWEIKLYSLRKSAMHI